MVPDHYSSSAHYMPPARSTSQPVRRQNQAWEPSLNEIMKRTASNLNSLDERYGGRRKASVYEAPLSVLLDNYKKNTFGATPQKKKFSSSSSTYPESPSTSRRIDFMDTQQNLPSPLPPPPGTSVTTVVTTTTTNHGKANNNNNNDEFDIDNNNNNNSNSNSKMTTSELESKIKEMDLVAEQTTTNLANNAAEINFLNDRLKTESFNNKKLTLSHKALEEKFNIEELNRGELLLSRKSQDQALEAMLDKFDARIQTIEINFENKLKE